MKDTPIGSAIFGIENCAKCSALRFSTRKPVLFVIDEDTEIGADAERSQSERAPAPGASANTRRATKRSSATEAKTTSTKTGSLQA